MCRSSLLCRCYDSACIGVCIVVHGYTTLGELTCRCHSNLIIYPHLKLSSRQAVSTDSFDSLLPSVPICLCSYLSHSVQQLLVVLLGWFVRLDVSGCTAVVLWGVAFRICSKQHTASFCSYSLAFSPGDFLKSKWCNVTIVMTWLKRINVLFHQRDQISI